MTSFADLLNAPARIDAPAETRIEETTETRRETLYRDAVGYNRSAPEQFASTSHDTVAPNWQHDGDVVAADKLSIRDKIEESFPHEIEKHQLQFADGTPSQHHSLRYGDLELPVSFKDNYVPHTREDIIVLADAANEAFGGDVKISATFQKGHLLCIAPSDEYRRSVFGGNGSDSINPRLIIDAGCDGSAVKASLGWYRDVCNNLTWLQSMAVVCEAIRHSSKLVERRDELVEKFQIVAEGWDKTVEFLSAMENRKVRTAALLSELWGDCPEETGRGKTTYVNRIEKIESIMTNERIKLGKPTDDVTAASAWEVYNAIQGYSQHNKTRRGNPDELQRISIAATDADVVKAERMLFAEELAPSLVLAN